MRHVSHEIRTPLNTAILGLKLLGREVRPPPRSLSHGNGNGRNAAQDESESDAEAAAAVVKEEAHSARAAEAAAAVAELVSDINMSCAIAVDILDDLLLYEKIDGGLLSLHLQRVEAWECVVDVLRMFRIQARSTKIDFTWPEVCLPGCVIRADRYKLSQVLRNLVSNALKFTPAEGEVHVSAQILPRTQVRERASVIAVSY